jgi:hypothetical protein
MSPLFAISILAGLLVAFLFLLVGVFASRGDTGEAERVDGHWASFAEKTGLAYSKKGGMRAAVGIVEGTPIRVVDSEGASPAGYSTGGAAIASSPSIPVSLTMLPKQSSARLDGGPVRSGDPEFDEWARMTGHPADVAAVLNEEVRDLLRGWLHLGRLHVEKGEVTVGGGGGLAAPKDLRRVTTGCLYIVRALQIEPIDRPRRLARNVAEDPESGVRLRNLRALAEHHSDAPELEPTLEAALADPHPAVRLYASERLDHESVGSHAREVARWLADADQPKRLARALSLVAQEGSLEDVRWLRPLTKGLFRSRKVKAAAEAAIDRIQERSGGHAGALAVLGEPVIGGQLSPVAGEAGAISETDEPQPIAPRKQPS